MADPAYRKSEEIWDEKSAFNFEKLMDPYREGGSQTRPVKRTMGILVDWLVNKKKYPIDVAGAAILIVFTEMFKGREFAGDGTYGSKARELDTVIRMTCDKLLQNKLKNKVFASIASSRMALINEFINREVELKTYPLIKKIFCRKKWRSLQKEYQSMVDEANKNEPA